MFKRIIICASLVLGVSFAIPANAQGVCGRHKGMVAMLKQQYEEVAIGMGLSSDGTLIEIFTSPSGTWSIVNTKPNGTACLVQAGKHWESKQIPKPPVDTKKL